jgi:hypothetical protein
MIRFYAGRPSGVERAFEATSVTPGPLPRSTGDAAAIVRRLLQSAAFERRLPQSGDERDGSDKESHAVAIVVGIRGVIVSEAPDGLQPMP